MNTSRSTPRLSKPVANEPVPSPALEYMRRRNRRRFFSLVHQELKRSGISRLELSKRMGRGMDRISHLLAAPGNWRLDTLSDVLFCISGAEPKHEPAYPLDRPARNRTRPEWLAEPDQDAEYGWIEETQKQTQDASLGRFKRQEGDAVKWLIEKVKNEDNKLSSQSKHSGADSGLAAA